MDTRTHTDSHGRPTCADGRPVHGRPACADGRPVCTEQTVHVSQNHPNSPRSVLVCVLIDSRTTRTVRVRSVGLFGPTLSRAGLRSMAGFGSMNIRRMSGDWIASVYRLCARAPNYRPTILLSFFTSIVLCFVLTCGGEFNSRHIVRRSGPIANKYRECLKLSGGKQMGASDAS
ncbi:unnamed protein product [Brassica rapa subsp. trilocularis]